MELIQHEYTEFMRNALHTLMDAHGRLQIGSAGFDRSGSHNSEQIEALTNMKSTENRDLILENQRQIAALNEKMDRLMRHLDVPPKPP